MTPAARLLGTRPVACHREGDGTSRLTHAAGMPEGWVTDHSIRRFRRRVARLPRKTVRRLLDRARHDSGLYEGEAFYTWGIYRFRMILRNGCVVTVMEVHHD